MDPRRRTVRFHIPPADFAQNPGFPNKRLTVVASMSVRRRLASCSHKSCSHALTVATESGML